jgi:integrase
MFRQLITCLDELLSKRRAEASREEMKRPAEERRDAATIDPSNLRKIFNQLLVDAGMRRIRCHDLRHTSASLLLYNGEA